MKSDKEILKQFDEHYQANQQALLNQYNEYSECVSFYNGDYMQYNDHYFSPQYKKTKEVSFNRVQPYVNSLVGFLIQNRKSIMYVSRNQDENVQRSRTDYINGLHKYIRENSNADQIETQQDIDFIIGGIGVTDTDATMQSDSPTDKAGGEILIERVSPIEVGWDTTAKQPNLIDASFCWRSKDYTEQQVIDIFDVDIDDLELNTEQPYTNYSFNPFGGIQDKVGFGFANYEQTLIRVYFYHWYEIENYYRIENPFYQTTNMIIAQKIYELLSSVEQKDAQEGFEYNPQDKILTITKDIYKSVKELFKVNDIPFNPVAFKRKVYFSAIVSGTRVLKKFKSASQQGFSMKFKTGKKNERTGVFTGLVHSMKEPQRYYNKALTEFMLIVASNPKGGIIAEGGAIDNIQEFERKYSAYNSVVTVNSLAGIKDKTTVQQNTGYEAIMQIAGESFEDVSGVSEAFFGAISGGNETAMLHRQRIKQASTVMASYIDSVDLYAKEQAELLLSFIRLLAEASEGMVFDVNDDNGNVINERISTQFLENNYGLTLQDAPESDMQRDYMANLLIQLGTSMQTTGDFQRAYAIYAEAIKFLPMSEKARNNISRILEGGNPIDPKVVQQLQQQIQLLTSRNAEIETVKKITEIEKDKVEITKKKADIESQKLSDRETLEDIEQKSIENDIVLRKPIDEINATI